MMLGSTGDTEATDPLGGTALTTHGVIYIDSNDDFVTLGFPGSGTVNDPYVIENLDIDADSNGYAIYMSNVDCHFTIRNCTLHGASEVEPNYPGSGIHFFQVTNGIISNNTLTGSDVGICLGWHSANTFIDNDISQNHHHGILLEGPIGAVFDNNSVTSNWGEGVLIKTAENITFINNSISQNDGGGISAQLTLADSLIANNTFYDNTWFGIELEQGSNDNVVCNNTIMSSGTGVSLDTTCSNNLFYHNTFLVNGASAIDQGSNHWNASYPLGGNYWDTHVADDIYKGASQDVYGQDCIYDEPYEIDVDSVDQYPLVTSWNGTVPIDTWSPSVVNITPGNGNISVNVSAPLSIEFSEFMNQSTIVYTISPLVDGLSLASDPGSPVVTIGHDVLMYNTTYTLNITAGDDLAGNGLSNVPYEVEFTTEVDLIPPHVSISLPTEGSFVGTPNVTVQWTGSDDQTVVDHYSIRVDNGSWYDVTGISHLIEGLSDGSHTVDVMAYDLAGNTATDSVTFTVDVTPPSLEITSPIDGSHIQGHMITITWNGSDSSSGLDHYDYRIDGSAWVNVGTDSDTGSLYFDDGEHVVDVRAVDSVGNSMVESVTFNIDNVAPTIEITSPSYDQVLNESIVEIEWNASDTGSGIDHFEIYLEGFFKWEVDGNATGYSATLPQGTNNINVRAFDLADNFRESAGVRVIVDSIEPTLSFYGLENDTAFGTTDVTMRWLASDPHGTGLNHTEVMLDDGDWIDVGTVTEHLLVDLTEGQHTFTVKVFDNAGNLNESTLWFWVDLTDPTMNITNPAMGGYENTNYVNFTWTSDDVGAGMDHFEFQMDGRGWLNAGVLDHFMMGVSINNGLHTVQMRAVDRAGNMGYDNVTFLVDTISPWFIDVHTDSEDGIWNDTKISIHWQADDSSPYYETSGIGGYQIAINGGAPIDMGMNTSYLISNLTDGYWEVVIIVHDNASNPRNNTLAFTVDMTPPEIWFTSETDGVLLGMDDELVVNWTADDNGTEIQSYWFFDEYNPDGSCRGLETSYTLSHLSDGEHVISVRAYDQAGNFDTVTMTFTVDAVRPTITMLEPIGDDAPVDSEVHVTFSETVNSSTLSIDVALGEGTIDGTIHVNGNVATFTPLDDYGYNATLIVDVFAEDLAGNNMTYSWTFTTVPENQLRDVSGTVLDDDGEPVIGATILVDGVEVGVTGADGGYTISLSEGAHTVRVSADGLEDQEFSVSADDSGDLGSIQMDATVSDDTDDSTLMYVAIAVIAVVAVIGAVLFMRKREGA